MRELIGIMTNVLFNQIRIIVRTRVNYSKEDFNFETYLSEAMVDDRLIRNAVFCMSGKFLLAEYFKFHHTQTDESLVSFVLTTYNDVT